MIRETFVPRPGWVYCSTDYAMLEACTLAQVCYSWFGHSEMREAINAGQDLHLRLAARIKGVTYDEAKALRKSGDKEIKNLRQSAKPINFGKPGLMGSAKVVFTARKDGVRFCELAGVQDTCGSSGKATEWNGRTISPTCIECLHLAKRYGEIWFQEYPEVREYHQRTIAMARAGERGVPLETHHTGMLRLVDSANAASNHQFQALGAAGAKHAAWLFSKECYTDPSSVLYNSARLVVFVHDELFTELREEVAHECALRQAEIMVSGMREFCPDVTIRAEPALARRWFKGAEAVYDKAGRLKPWWPKSSEWKWGPDQEQAQKDREA